MSDFPRFVYQAKGRFQRKGGTYDYSWVQTAEEQEKLLKEGWFESLEAAINPPKPTASNEKPTPEPIVDDNSPPTREELEAKAAELGLKVDGRHSDKKIAQLIDEALSK